MVVAGAAGRSVRAAGARTRGRPRVGARAALGRHREAREGGVQGREQDRTARAATARAVVQRRRAYRTVRGDRPGAGDAADANHDHPAARRAARQESRAVVAGARAAARSHRHPGGGGREGDAAVAADVEAAVPGLAAVAAGAPVAAAAAPGVLVIAGRMAVGPAAAGGCGPAAGEAAVDRRALVGVVRAGVDEGTGAGGVVDPARRARDAFTLGGVEILGRGLDVVGVGAARVSGQLAGAASPEPEPGDAHRRAAQGESPRDVDRQDAARRPVPRRRRQRRAEGGGAVLRHPDDLEFPLAVRAAVGDVVAIGVHEAARVRARDREIAAGQADRDDVLVEARVAERRVPERRARDAAAVGAGVGRIDVGVLHLDDQEEVARRDARRGAARGADRDDRGPGGDAGRAGIVGVDDAGEGPPGAVFPGCRAVDCRWKWVRRDEKRRDQVAADTESEERPQSSSQDSSGL